MQSATKDRWLLRLFVICLLTLGFSAGAVATRLAHIYGYFQAPATASDSLTWVVEQLELPPTQRAHVASILNEHQAANKSRMTRQMKRQYRERFLETDQRLRSILTPEQYRRYRKAFNQWLKRRTDGLRVQ